MKLTPLLAAPLGCALLVLTSLAPVALGAPRTSSACVTQSAWGAGRLRVEAASGWQRLYDGDGELLRETTRAIEQARLLELPDSPVRLLTWSEREGRAPAFPHYRISLDGRSWSRERETSYALELRRGRFDPLVQAAPISAESRLASGGELCIVQFVTQPLECFRDRIRALGGEVLRFLPHHAQIVRLSPPARDALARLPYVRWIGSYDPQYRLDPELSIALESDSLPARAPYLIQVCRRGLEDKLRVAAELEASGGRVLQLTEQGLFLEAELSPACLAHVVALDQVLFVDPSTQPRTYMNLVRADGGADFLESQTGFTGAGVRAEVLDTGFLTSHQAFQSNPPLLHDGNSTDTFHGTAVAGCLFGDGSGNPAARATLPDAQPIFASFANLTDRYLHTQELLAAPYFAVLQSNSWGYGYGSTYNNRSTEIDDILFLNDITILQAQGNSGSQASDHYAWGKNVVSIGGIRHLDTLGTADDNWSNAGSRGPAEDGRIKPDLCYWFDSIMTTSDSGGTMTDFGGTSAATPEAAGYFGLFFQMWHAGVFGNYPSGATVFDSRPHASTAKAMLINSADQYSFSGGSHDLRRVTQGWGRPDVQHLYERRDQLFVIDESQLLSNLQSVRHDLEVAPGQPELRATLCYLDPAGTTSAAQHRVNDLSLRLTAPSGLVYWGNHLMKGNMFTQPGGGSNTLDTVENVWLENPEAGFWAIEVLADEINQDAHVETAAIDADFALVVSGVEPRPCNSPTNYCAASPNSVGTGATISASGTSSIAANDLVLHVSGLPPRQPGLFYYGATQESAPFGDGQRCISTPNFWLAIVYSDTLGRAAHALDLANPPSAAAQIGAGSSWNFQLWYRDPAAAASGFNLSDGLSVLFCQ